MTRSYPKESEHEHQKCLFRWAALEAGKRPELALLFAIPNGGARHISVARKLKAEGVRAGVPDIFLPVVRPSLPRHDCIYYGLFIEMKIGRNKPTAQQLWWHEKLKDQGYKVVVAYGWPAAKDAIVDYLEGRG